MVRADYTKRVIELMFVALPKMAAGAGTIGVGVLLLRYFGPAQYGFYALCVSGLLLADGVLGAAIDTGLLRLASAAEQNDPARSRRLQQAALAAKLAAGGACALAVALAAGTIGERAAGGAGAASMVRWSCAAVIALLVFRTAQAQAQVAGRFAFYGALDLLQSLLKFGSIAALIACDAVTPERVLACFAAGPAGASLVWAATRGGRAVLWGGLFDCEALGELWRHTRWVLPTFALAAFTSRLDLICLAAWSGVEQVGILSAAAIVVLVPQLFGAYLSVILTPRIMPLWEAGRFFSFFRRFQLASFAVCGALLVAGVSAAEFAGAHLLPASFARSEPVLIALLPGALAGLATFPLTLTFLMFMRPRFLFWTDCVGLGLMILCYRLAIPAHGALGAACVTSLVCVVKATLAQIVAWRLARRGESPANLALQIDGYTHGGRAHEARTPRPAEAL